MPGILIIAEHLRGALSAVTGECIGAATAIKDQIGGPVTVAIVGDKDLDLTAEANLNGVDQIIKVEADAAHFNPAIYEEAAFKVGTEQKPQVVLMGHTVNTMAYAPALAARLGSGFATDVFGLEVDGGEVVATRAGYGNKVNVELAFPGKGVTVLTLRGATFMPPEEPGNADVSTVSLDASDLAERSVHVDYEDAPQTGVDISKAEFILSVGRGIQDKDNLPRFAELAERLGATFACSRPIVDSGWLPKPHQVGQSGKVAANCKLYIALGISGAVQHLFGMKHVDTIIAINTDPDAPIFNVATYGANVDIFEFAEAIERKFN